MSGAPPSTLSSLGSESKEVESSGLESSNVSAKGKGPASISYTYWTAKPGDGVEAPVPVAAPKKLSEEEAKSIHRTNSVGSVWNQAGTWEEVALTRWGQGRLKEIVESAGPKEYSWGSLTLKSLEKWSGDVTKVVIRNKPRHGYTLDFTVTFEAVFGQPSSTVTGKAEVHEAAMGELEDMQLSYSLDGKQQLEAPERKRLKDALQEQIVAALEDFEVDLKKK